MRDSETIAASKSFLQTYTLFVWLIKWFLELLGLRGPEKQNILSTKTLKNGQDEYVEKLRARFLATFDSDSEAVGWNENISAIFFSNDALAKTLEDPDNEVEKKWRRSILIESTPRGNVFMFYDVYKQAFSYYSDQTVMPYEIMNAVAMKYVMTFRCRDFFVDSLVIPQKTREDETRTSATTATTTTTTVSSSQPIVKKSTEGQPFAKFKSYNTATKKIADKANEKTINRFLHLGGVRNWSPIHITKKLNPLNGFKTDMIPNNQKLSYAEYKKVKFAANS
jgi:hypothetical protein